MQLEPYLQPWRKVEIKRRTKTGYESSWLDISHLPTSWPTISFKSDTIRPFVTRIGSADMSFRSDEKQMSSQNNSGSLFSGFLTRYRTLVRISTGLEDDNGVQYPTSNSNIFYGLMSNNISDELLETRIPIANISIVLDEFDSELIAPSITGAKFSTGTNTLSITGQTLSVTGSNYNASGNTISLTGQTLSLTGTYSITGNTLSTSGGTISTTLSNFALSGKRTVGLENYTLSQAGYTLSSTNQTISTTGGGPGLRKEASTGPSYLDFRGNSFSTTFTPTLNGGFTVSTTDYTLSFSVSPISVGANWISCPAQIISITGNTVNTVTGSLSVTSYALTSKQILETIRDYTDSNSVVVLDNFLSSGAWLLTSTGRLYTIPTSTSLSNKSAFKLIEDLALAENYMFFIDRNSNVRFEDRQPTGTSVYTFSGTGPGIRNTNIEAIEHYSEGIDKIYTKFTLELADSATVSTQEAFSIGDESSSWKYGQREYKFSNKFVNTATAGSICSELLDYFKTERDELTLRTKYIAPNLDIKDIITVNHLGEAGGDGSLWDKFLWDHGLFSDEHGAITLNNVDFFITGISINTNKWYTTYNLKKKVN